MQAMLHAAEQLLLHKGPATIYEENEDESSGDEDIADRILAAAGAAAAEGVQAAGAIASQGVEHLLNVSHDLAQGAENVGAHVSPAMLEAYHTYASQLAQLADEGYDNVEVLPAFACLLPASRLRTCTPHPAPRPPCFCLLLPQVHAVSTPLHVPCCRVSFRSCSDPSCALRPAPCALRPAPCALRPAPCALRPGVYPRPWPLTLGPLDA